MYRLFSWKCPVLMVGRLQKENILRCPKICATSKSRCKNGPVSYGKNAVYSFVSSIGDHSEPCKCCFIALQHMWRRMCCNSNQYTNSVGAATWLSVSIGDQAIVSAFRFSPSRSSRKTSLFRTTTWSAPWRKRGSWHSLPTIHSSPRYTLVFRYLPT